MSIEEYLEENKSIQDTLLDYLDNDTRSEEEFHNLIKLFDNKKIHSDKYKIKSLFNLILQISNNHHRNHNFFSKIEQILKLFKGDIKQNFSNSEIFLIFKGNKRLLLFLIEEKLITVDEYMAKKIINEKNGLDPNYPKYFQPEIQPFINEKSIFQFDQKEIPSNFYENRKIVIIYAN